MTDEVVSRLYRILVDELRRRGHPEGEPLKVAELYETVVPYRAVRPALGLDLNADYEHALLRLLSGERGLLRLEPAAAMEELRREADTPYPAVGLFRKFSGCRVWVEMPDSEGQEVEVGGPAEEGPGEEPTSYSQARGRGRAGARASEEPAGARRPASPTSGTEPGGARPVRIAAEAAPDRSIVRLHAADSDATGPLTPDGVPCAFCGEELPAGRNVRFCPHCGGDQRLQPCTRCDAVLERGWRYCISCGQEMTAD